MPLARAECDDLMNFHQILPPKKKKTAKRRRFSLYLLMHAFVLIVIAIILLLATVFFSVYCIFTAPKYKGEFSIGDFSDTIELFPFSSNKNYGKIRDYKSAGQIGKNIINE